jgi:hypothetical protein
MNNLSELIMRGPPTPEVRAQAEAWARQALGVIERAQSQPSKSTWFTWGKPAEDEREVCEQALGVVLFNLGSLREVCVRSERGRKCLSAICIDVVRLEWGKGVVREERRAVRQGRYQRGRG